MCSNMHRVDVVCYNLRVKFMFRFVLSMCVVLLNRKLNQQQSIYLCKYKQNNKIRVITVIGPIVFTAAYIFMLYSTDIHLS